MEFDAEQTESLFDGERPRPPPLGVVVRVEGVSATPARFMLRGGVCVIGSGAAADVVLDDRSVSRTHAELRVVPEGVALDDLGSRNGTFYKGQRITKMILGLDRGSHFNIGRATVFVEPDLAEDTTSRDRSDAYGGLVGTSPAMQKVFAILERLEGSLVPVLIEGESGVGKEVVARSLHDASSVASGPFVALNCGAFARELLASELFGHKKGAFTGAVDARKGAIESADGGTLFLDELGEMPLDVQPMLLRFLESGEVRPLGSDTVKRVRVRVLSATNRDIDADVAAGRFREDLFYRLAVVRLWIPPLRDRREDIEPIALHLASVLGVPAPPREFIARLRGREWRGNVRELRNVMQAFAVLGDLADAGRAAKRGESLADLVDLERPYLELKDEIVERFTRLYMTAMLDKTGGNQAEAARASGLDRTYLGRLLARLKIER